MELIEGYQKADIGIIPEYWEIKTFGEISYMKGRIGWQGLKQTEFTDNPDEPYLITGMNFKDGEINWDEVYHISFKRYEIAKDIQLKPGDVLMTKDGTIGKLLYVERIPYPYKASLNSHLLVFRPIRNSYNPKFLYYQLDSSFFKNHIELNKSGTTFYGVSQETVSKYQIPLPPLCEQKAIAEVLSDTDNLIQSLEKQIAKKRMIKQGAMQKLLSPKKWWKEYIIGDIGRTYGGLSGKSKSDFQDGIYPYIPFMNIMSNPRIDIGYLDYVKIKPHESQNKALKDDLFFNGSSETPEEVGMCSVLTVDVPNLYLNSFCFGFRLNKEYKHDGLFLSYFFRSDYGRSMFYSLAQGATRYNLSKSNFLKMKLLLPPYEDQLNIANILSDIDAEIESLESKVSKYKTLKKGLMQNLLTGKTRLKTD